MRSTIVSLTMSPGLLAQVDELARQENESRSWVMRRAMREYIKEAGIGEPVITRTDSGETKVRIAPPKPERDYKQIVENLKPKHPNVHLYDKELLAFLDDFENGRL